MPIKFNEMKQKYSIYKDAEHNKKIKLEKGGEGSLLFYCCFALQGFSL